MFPLPPLSLLGHGGWQSGSRGTLVARTREAAGHDAKCPTLPGAAGRRVRFQHYIPQRACDVTIEHLREAALSQPDDVKPRSGHCHTGLLGCGVRWLERAVRDTRGSQDVQEVDTR